MISNSYTFNEAYDDYDRMTYYFNTTGCTEYPALSWKIQRHVMLPLFIFSEDSDFRCNIDENLVKLFGKDYTRKQYVTDYINMVYNMFEPINEKAGKALFSLYTFKEYKADASRKLYGGYNKLVLNASGIERHRLGSDSGNAIKSVEFSDDDVIGMATECTEIRKIMGAKYTSSMTTEERCRKIQLAHTALRLIYSNGYQIALVALKLYKDYHINPLYAFWIAYNVNSNGSSSYGDLFMSGNVRFVSYDTFVNRFFDKKLNGSVQAHFNKEEHPLAEYINIDPSSNILTSRTEMLRYLFDKYTDGQLAINYLSKNNIKDKVDHLVEMALESVTTVSITVKFVFTKKLFNSTALNVSYDGIEIPGSKLGRIIFKDENETALSVLKTSKFINIKTK